MILMFFMLASLRHVCCHGHRSRSNISGTMRDRKLKFYTDLDRAKYSLKYENISARGRAGGATPLV